MSKAERVKSKRFKGVYFRELAGKHNGRQDRAYWITWTECGKKKWLMVGKLSTQCTEQLAYQKLTNILSALNKGDEPGELDRKRKVTLEEVIQAFFEWRKGEGKDVYSDISRYNKHVEPFFGHIQIRNITLEMLDRFKIKLLETQAPSSAKKLLGTMRAAVNFAIRRGMYVGQNPISAKNSFFTMPREDNKGERYLTGEEVKALFEELAVRSETLHDMAYISLYTGMRAAEIFGLAGKDIDVANKVVNIYAKGGARRQVLLTDDVMSVLPKHVRKPEDLLFPKRGGGRRNAISDSFSRAVDALGLNYTGDFRIDENGDKKPVRISDTRQKVWFHTLRHTFASWLAQSGKVSLHELMQLMRHKDINMTLRYAHLIPDRQREHLKIIGEIMADPVQ